MSTEPMIRVEGLQRSYGAVRALEGVSFQVPRGQVVGFLGPNGAGKTTTLKILTGFLAASGGFAEVAGRRVDRDDSFRNYLGYLPENSPIWPELTVGEVLAFSGRIRGLRGARLRAAQAAALARCELEPMLHRPAGALSKGYRQRLGLALAILHDPPVLILDEPTTGLDPNQVQQVRALVRSLGQAKTVLFSSHVLQEVQAVADRVLILDRGRLVADDSPARLGARLAGGRVRVEVVAAADAAAVEACLAAVPGAAGVQAGAHRPDALVFEVAGPPELRPALAQAVVQAGFGLLRLDVATADLEAVFRHLTREAA